MPMLVRHEKTSGLTHIFVPAAVCHRLREFCQLSLSEKKKRKKKRGSRNIIIIHPPICFSSMKADQSQELPDHYKAPPPLRPEDINQPTFTPSEEKVGCSIQKKI